MIRPYREYKMYFVSYYKRHRRVSRSFFTWEERDAFYKSLTKTMKQRCKFWCKTFWEGDKSEN